MPNAELLSFPSLSAGLVVLLKNKSFTFYSITLISSIKRAKSAFQYAYDLSL